MKRTLLCITGFGCGCFGEVPMEGDLTADESSSSTTDAASLVTTASVSSSTSSGSPDSEGSDDPTTDGESSSTTEPEESSTGEARTDFALFFDGEAMVEATESYDWEPTEFTIELWAHVDDASRADGILIEARNEPLTAGWIFYIEPGSQLLTFGFTGDQMDWNYVLGPTATEIGEGWHHLAATLVGNTLLLFVDGVTTDEQTVNPVQALPNSCTFRLGHHPQEMADWQLDHVALDDVRIVDFALYTSDFDPPVVVDDEHGGSTLLLLPFDENDGMVASDLGSDLTFSIDGAQWTEGQE